MFTNADPHRSLNGIHLPHPKPETSKGTTIGLTGIGDDHDYPANVADHQPIVTLPIRRNASPPTDFDLGQQAWLHGKDIEPDASPEWLDGYESAYLSV